MLGAGFSRVACGHDLAIGLHCHRIANVDLISGDARCKIRGADVTGAAERQVERTVAVEPRRQEIGAGAAHLSATGEAAVAHAHDCVQFVIEMIVEVVDHESDADRAEAGIDRAGVGHACEHGRRASVAETGHDQRSVGIEHAGARSIAGAAGRKDDDVADFTRLQRIRARHAHGGDSSGERATTEKHPQPRSGACDRTYDVHNLLPLYNVCCDAGFLASHL